MAKIDFEQKVKEVIASLSVFEPQDIKLSDKLTQYISDSMKSILIVRLKYRFRRVDEHELSNTLYTTIKKVQDLVTKIKSYYPENL